MSVPADQIQWDAPAAAPDASQIQWDAPGAAQGAPPAQNTGSQPSSVLGLTLEALKGVPGLGKLLSEDEAELHGAEREGLGLANLVHLPGASNQDLQAWDAAHKGEAQDNAFGNWVGQTAPWVVAQLVPGLDVGADLAKGTGMLPLAVRAARSMLPSAVAGAASAPVGQQGTGAALGGLLGVGGATATAGFSKAGQALKDFLQSDLGQDALATSGVGKLFLPIGQTGKSVARTIYQRVLPRALGATTALQDQYQQLAQKLPKVFDSAYDTLLGRWASPGQVDMPKLTQAVVDRITQENPDVPTDVLARVPNLVKNFGSAAASGARGVTGNSIQNALNNLPAIFRDTMKDVPSSVLSADAARGVMGSTRDMLREGVLAGGLSPEDQAQFQLLRHAYSAAGTPRSAIFKGTKPQSGFWGHNIEALPAVYDILHAVQGGDAESALRSAALLGGAMTAGRAAASQPVQNALRSSALPAALRTLGLGMTTGAEEAQNNQGEQ